ncbi:hypothetical protein ES703_125834 [subsurface metagenome]
MDRFFIFLVKILPVSFAKGYKMKIVFNRKCQSMGKIATKELIGPITGKSNLYMPFYQD